MMANLRYLLAIYVHAHQTGNSVPPHIDAEARAALADEPAVPQGREPVSVTGQPSPLADAEVAELSLRVQRLEAMRETEKAALLDAFRQIDDLKQRIDFQYMKIHRLEDALPLSEVGE